jgi:hypothetical protein
VDGVPVAARYAGLTVGSHTFGVRAKDAAGNVDATPATFSWTIASGGGASVLLAGNGTVEAPADEIQIRQAEAWPVTASASGTAGVISVYLDSSTTVNDLQVALYANNNGVPGTRLAVGTTSGVTPRGLGDGGTQRRGRCHQRLELLAGGHELRGESSTVLGQLAHCRNGRQAQALVVKRPPYGGGGHVGDEAVGAQALENAVSNAGRTA